MSANLIDVYRSLSGHWPGVLLLTLSIVTFSFVLAGLVAMLHQRTENRDWFLLKLSGALEIVEDAAPTVGLIGTIYGLIGGLFTAKPEHIPFFIAVALYTTYIGGIIFLICLLGRTAFKAFAPTSDIAPR